MNPTLIAVQVSADQLKLLVLGWRRHEQAVVCCSELRIGQAPLDELRSTTGRLDTINARIPAPRVRGQAATAAGFERNRPAVGREGRSSIMAGLGRDSAACPAARRDCLHA